jgi:arabinose-5-phosphate isomerase
MPHWTEIGKQVVRAEIRGLINIYRKFGPAFSEAVDVLRAHSGKIVVTGIGKSGYVAKKMVSTFNSTGTRAVFLHPSEAMHGDLGIVLPGDPILLISKSGSTEELVRMIPVLRSFRSPLIALLGNIHSPIARKSDIILDASVPKEADLFGFVPTSSTLAALSLGDALACTLMQARGFQKNDFLRYHPSGQLGHNLSLTAQDTMHTLPQVAVVSPEDNLRQVVIAMTEKSLGAAFVFEKEQFVGLITDGDVRRALRTCPSIEAMQATHLMTRSPIYIYADMSLDEAVRLMEDRPSQIDVLPVKDRKTGLLTGLLRLHDVYQSRHA